MMKLIYAAAGGFIWGTIIATSGMPHSIAIPVIIVGGLAIGWAVGRIVD